MRDLGWEDLDTRILKSGIFVRFSGVNMYNFRGDRVLPSRERTEHVTDEEPKTT